MGKILLLFNNLVYYEKHTTNHRGIFMTKISTEQKMDDLINAWDSSTSLDDAFLNAGIVMPDRRARMRFRRATENTHGIQLAPHNPQHSTMQETLCPSTLDLSKAKKKKGIIATSYTNNTILNTEFLDTLEHIAKAHNLQILTRPIRYANPNAVRKAEDYHWDKRIIPYVINDDYHVTPTLVFSAVSLQATTANPLAGKQIAYGNKSVIYGGSSLEIDSVATPKEELPKLLFSTGSLNIGKYSNSDAGIKAAARHTLSAIIFIKVNNYYRDYILEWDGQGISFFDEYWTPEGKDNKPASYEAIHFGDAHAEGLTPSIIKQRMKLVDKLDPKILIWNDLHNHGAGSHHNTMIENIKRQQLGMNSVRAEVQMSVDVLNKMGKGRENILVRSNHHDHLEQWLNRCKPHQDIQNAEYYFWLMNKVAQNPDKSPLELAMEDGLKVNYKFVDGDKSFDVAGIDCGQHGDKGPDGARSAVGFHKLSRKIQSGHTHKRWIKGLHWTSGVMPLELGYNKGYGTWSSTDTVITTEGTRSHVTFIKGKFWK